MIIQRIDMLDFDAMTALKIASVLGQSFLLEDLEYIYPNQARKALLVRFLETCKKQKLVVQSATFSSHYSFPSDTIRDVAYNMLLTSQRQRIHESVAKYFEEKYQASLSRYYPFLAYHYSRANLREKALHYYNLSANQAVMTRCSQEVIKYLTEVYKIVEEEGIQFSQSQRSKWEYLLGEAYFNCGLGRLAMKHYAECLRLCGVLIPDSEGALNYAVSKATMRARVKVKVKNLSTALRCNTADVMPMSEEHVRDAGTMQRDASVPLFQRAEPVRRSEITPSSRNSTKSSLQHQGSLIFDAHEEALDMSHAVLVCLSRLAHLNLLDGKKNLMAMCCQMIVQFSKDQDAEVDSIQTFGLLSLLFSVEGHHAVARAYISHLRMMIATQDVFGGSCIRAAVSLLGASMALLAMGDMDGSLRHYEAGLSYSVLVNDPRTQMEFYIYNSFVTFLRHGIRPTEELALKIQKMAKAKSDVQLFCAYSIIQGWIFGKSPRDSSLDVLSSIEDSIIYLESLGENAIPTDRIMLKSIYAVIHHRIDIVVETFPLIMECDALHILVYPGVIACLNVLLRQVKGDTLFLRQDRNLSVVEKMMEDRKQKAPLIEVDERSVNKAYYWGMIKQLTEKMVMFTKRYPILEPCTERYLAYICLEKKQTSQSEKHFFRSYQKAEALDQKMEMCLASLELYRHFEKANAGKKFSNLQPWDSIMRDLHMSEFASSLEKKSLPF
eukprot:TRINITY_DN20145_c0_g1_i1.p1 TRINITY_DN20145_c0_g1~~TRINITY_DN20145_c0_g1_i1.p1  ORF type:complete len:827 (+),score=147.96 TRINITY_DN20145_c0_g1_i1:318-2483(+)